MVPTMLYDNKNDTTLTTTKSAKLDDERSKREDYLEYSEHDISNFIRDYLLMNSKSTIKCNLEKLGKIVLEEINRCGALNTMET